MTLPEFMRLFDEFKASSWDGWRTVLGRLTTDVREFFAVVGRGAGKSRIVALIACWFASRAYTRVAGEFIYVGIFAPDRKQAGVTFRYVVGLLKSVPSLAALIVAERADSIELSNGVVIEVLTASVAAPRGRAYALVIIEEAAFLRTDDSANPDVELLRAVRPALARVPGSLLAVVSSPYARRGILYQAWTKHHANPVSDVVVVQAGTLELNPAFDRRAIEVAREEDPASAAAEYDAQFRSDVESFIAFDVLRAATVDGRFELAPVVGQEYKAFWDGSGGSADSAALAIAHNERGRLVLDAVRERRPPFSPEDVIAEHAAVLKTYDIRDVTADAYAGEYPRELFRKHHIQYHVSTRSKSTLYSEVLPLLNSKRVELLNVPRLLTQFATLERRVSRGGKDSIDHGPRQHDDLANSVAGALVLAATDVPRVWWDNEANCYRRDYGITF